MNTCTGAPLPAPAPAPAPAAVITDTEMVLAPEKEGEEKGKPLDRLAPTNLAEPGEKPYVPPMTDEERQKIEDLKKLHMAAVKALQEVMEDRKELRKYRDDLLFHRRCLAARLVNRILFRRREAAFFGDQLRLGLKEGHPLPEELVKAREPLNLSLDMYLDMSRAMKLGLDKFLVMYCSHLETERKKMMEQCEKEVEAESEAVHEQNGAALDSDAQN